MTEGSEGSEGTGASRPRRFVSGISVATRLSIAVVIVSLLSLIVTTVIGLGTGERLGEELYDDQINGMRSSGDLDATAYLNSLERTAEALVLSPVAAPAVQELSAALEKITIDDVPDAEQAATALADEYQERYIDVLGEAGRTVDVRDLIASENPAVLYLQNQYAIDFAPLAEPAAIDNARDGSEWSEQHAVFHPVYRRVAGRLGLSDLMLVDTDTGRIVYTVEKRPDLGASVDVGPASGSIVSTLVDRVRGDPTGGVQAADFRRYNPALLTPVAGMAAPILDDSEELVGALVMLFDSSELTRILTADGELTDSELNEAADRYLIGTDGTTRTDPHDYAVDPDAFLDGAEASGSLSEDGRALVDLAGTTVLAVYANDATVNAAEDDDTSVGQRPSIDGIDTFSSVEELAYDGFPLFVVAEIESETAEQAVEDFETLLIVGVAIFMVLLAFAAAAWANTIVRPIRALSDRLATGSTSDEPISVPDRSPIEFHKLAARFDTMATTIDEQHGQLAAARRDRLALMKRLLPNSVADRLAAGDALSLDEAPDASVAVLTFVGLSAEEQEFATAATPDRERETDAQFRRDGLEELLAQLDHLARHHGLEPIKIIGDEYYAAIGHERPYIDHAPRAVRFALEAFDLVTDSAIHRDDGVDLSAGVASGPVTAGLAGTSRLVYDVWGVTVRRADQLAQRAGAGKILVADATAAKLPDTVRPAEAGEVVGQMAWAIDVEEALDQT